MNLLEYKIAWIDDQPDKAQGFKERIGSLLGRSGFELKVDWVATESDLATFLKSLTLHSEYDLIMVDWKLGRMLSGGGSGASVAHEIRAKQFLATVIFYSAETPDTLRREIAEQLIDGVYCVNRMHFFHEASLVIKASIRKFSEMHTMRGLFLAAVAEFDDMIRGCTIKAYKGITPTHQHVVKEKLVDGSVNYLKEQLVKAEAIDRSGELTSIMKELNPTSWQLFECLHGILSIEAPSPRYTACVEKFQQYGKEILMPRNDMAHLKEKIKNGEKVLARGDREWTPEKFDKLRLTLSDHHENLNYIQKLLIDELIAQVQAKVTKE